MGFFNQLSSLFKLPGALIQSRQAAGRNAQVKALAAKPLTAPKPAAIGPAIPPPTYTAPVSAPQEKNPQIDAITSALGGLTTGLQNLQKTAATPTPAPISAPSVDTLAPIEQELTSNITPTAEEQDIRKKLSNLIASKNLGLLSAEDQPIPLQAILGEQSKIERRGAIEQGTLQDRLTQLQAARQGSLDVAKTKYDIAKTRLEYAKPDEEKVSDFINDQGEQVVSFRNKKTGAIRNEVLGKAQGKGASQTDRDRGLKTGAIGVARPLLIQSRGADGYVNPATYLKLRNDYAEAIGTPSAFDATFAPMLSPDERKRLGVGTFSSAASDSIGSILASYLGGT